MSTIKVDNLQTTGGVGLYPAKAWVNFRGTSTVSIYGSGNVSSVTDNGTGRYTCNMASSLASANYATSHDNTSYETNNATVNNSLEGTGAAGSTTNKLTSSVRGTNATGNTNYDSVSQSVLIFL